MKRNVGANIGIFDSGFGGLTVLRGIVKNLPQYNYIYLGDTARAPYGTRSRKIIYEFNKEGINFLFQKNCGLVILACNTVSSDALRKIQQEYLIKKNSRRKILGVLIPASEEAVKITKNKRVGVIATESTIQSGAFMREITKLDPKIKLFQKSCPLLVPIVEAGEQNSKAAEFILEDYLRPLKMSSVDTLILGCTHYGILENKIRKIMGKNISIISEEEIVPEKLKTYLKKHKEIERKLAKNRCIEFYSTDLTDKFQILGSKFFGKHIQVQKAVLK